MKFNKKILAMLVALVMLITSLGTLVVFAQNIGADGIVPSIGTNGNWWIGDTDTGVSAVGAKGETGDQGPKGETGDKGAKGETGDQGAKGETGDVGPKGETGDQGAKGETGDQGAKGETGDKGEKGETGDQGATGADGFSGRPGKDAVAPRYRFNYLAERIEISDDDGKSWSFLAELPSSATELNFDIESIEVLPGTIAYELYGTYITTNDCYQGSQIDITDCAYNTVTLKRNENGSPIVYAFLAEELRINEKPVYAEGCDNVVLVLVEETVTLTIPENAKYLYLYYYHANEETKENDDYILYVPSEVVFKKNETSDVETEKNPLQDSELSEYDYPVEEISKLGGAIDEQTNRYKNGTSGSKGAYINVKGTVFNTVTLTKNANGNSFGYAFLSDLVGQNLVPTYATGYTTVVWEDAESVTLKIPENASFLYLSYENEGDSCLPSSVEFTKSEPSEENDNSVRLATWNIGHFSLGENKSTAITSADYDVKKREFLDYINYSVNADVFALNEYSKIFQGYKKASETIFESYEEAYEFEQRNYSCNAVFSKLPLKNVQLHEFECNKNAVITHTDKITAPDYYYVTAELEINGKTVVLVMTHLAFDDTYYETENDSVNRNQMLELIEVCEQYERVVLMGDWNAAKFSYFNEFVEAGYTLANEKADLPTYKSSVAAARCIDNIIYKGVTVSDFTLAGTDLSDHYAIYCTITVED